MAAVEAASPCDAAEVPRPNMTAPIAPAILPCASPNHFFSSIRRLGGSTVDISCMHRTVTAVLEKVLP